LAIWGFKIHFPLQTKHAFSVISFKNGTETPCKNGAMQCKHEFFVRYCNRCSIRSIPCAFYWVPSHDEQSTHTSLLRQYLCRITGSDIQDFYIWRLAVDLPIYVYTNLIQYALNRANNFYYRYEYGRDKSSLHHQLCLNVNTYSNVMLR